MMTVFTNSVANVGFVGYLTNQQRDWLQAIFQSGLSTYSRIATMAQHQSLSAAHLSRRGIVYVWSEAEVGKLPSSFRLGTQTCPNSSSWSIKCGDELTREKGQQASYGHANRTLEASLVAQRESDVTMMKRKRMDWIGSARLRTAEW